MARVNSPGQSPKKKPDEKADDLEDYVKRLRESGLKVIETTTRGGTTIFVGGVRKQPKR